MGEETRPYSESEKNMAGLGEQNRVAWGEPPAQTQIVLYEGIPLDDTYTDVYYVNGGDNNAFLDAVANAKYEYTNYTYQRVNSSVAQPRKPLTLRVDENADRLYKCNYLRFLNRTDNKWFYAFIKKVNYVAPNTTEIEYEIDHFMTWFNTCTIMPCYVEREHIITDSKFVNLIPEPVDITSSEVVEVYEREADFYVTVVTSEESEELSGFGGVTVKAPSMETGIYTGLWCYIFSHSLATVLDGFLAEVSNPEIIVAIFTSYYKPRSGGGSNSVVSNDLNITDIRYRNSEVFGIGSGETYTVKNNKLLNSQFRYYLCVTASNDSIVLKPEFLEYNYPAFKEIFNNGLTPSRVFLPRYEKQINGNWKYAIENQCYIQSAWANDSFKSWWANNSNTYLKNIATNIGLTVAGVATQNPYLGVMGVSGLAGNITTALDAENKADASSGKVFDDASNIASKKPDLIVYCIEADIESIKRADKFLDMYGYATNEVKTPNLTQRPNWNYVKLKMPIIKGSCPVESMEKIKSIFVNGVRLWHNAATFGDFTQNNEP